MFKVWSPIWLSKMNTLEEAIKKSGKSVKQVAKGAKVPFKELLAYVNSKQECPDDIAHKVAVYLKYPIDWVTKKC